MLDGGPRRSPFVCTASRDAGGWPSGAVPCLPPQVAQQNAPRVRRVKLSFLHWNRLSRSSSLKVALTPSFLGGVPLFQAPWQKPGPGVDEHPSRVAVGGGRPQAQLHRLDAKGSQQSGRLQQCAKFIRGETGIADDAAHRVSVDRIVPRNRQDAGTVSHDDVLSLPEHPEPSLLENSNSCLVVDARTRRHV